ncbi:glycosyltransferase family 4 protein [Nakamurella aerolata]|uniref:Glycosyltransferase family 4 protein n=1 Tax=Nakamurella aerolata TaxID=1656892 RepID=A0A849A6V7_9ACTN|nr:glycosyltransferase family 4 protein [Nakamurella aerolata]NNG36289.1 glycosyltransferase family 4 protein [Nakamurella aerolata]
MQATTTKPQRILVVTDDAVGSTMAGPAIRAWNIAKVLADAGHDVRLASTLRAEGSSPDFAICDGSPEFLPGLARGMDVIVTQGFTLKYRPWLADMGAKMVVDLYDPIHLETLEGEGDDGVDIHQSRVDNCLDALQVQMLAGDFFLCASPAQRQLWLGHLSALGRINVRTYAQDSSLEKLIAIAPFGISETPPQPLLPDGRHAIKGTVAGIEPDDTLLLWAGGVYNWFDPVTLVRAVAALAPEHPRLKLMFMGTKHPSLDDLSTTVLRQAVATAEQLGLLASRVFFREGWVPYEQRGAYLSDADIGVSTHFLHAETAFSFRTRMLDYLWAGLPMVGTEGDEFARLIAADGLGAVVPATDVPALTAALRRLLDDPAALAAAAEQVRRLAPDYYWRKALAPLVEYCADPYFAADRGHPSGVMGTAQRLGAGIDKRTAHLQEYLRVNGAGMLLRRAPRLAARRVAAIGRRLGGS